MPEECPREPPLRRSPPREARPCPIRWALPTILLLVACPAPGPAPPRAARAVGPARTSAALGAHLCRLTPGDWRPLLAPRFQAGLSERGVRRIFRKHRRLYGPCLEVVAGKGPLVTWRHQGAEVTGRIYRDAKGRLNGLWFDDVRVPGDTWARILADLKALPGQTSLLVREAGAAPLAAHAPGQALAVASTAKIFVLKALAQEIRDGRLRWDDVVRFDPARRSFPTAPLNAWPPGGPLTLATLATYMIAHSDNTATDHLIAHLGRALVEQHAGTHSRPFLTTREAFVLKSPGHAALAARYAAADEAGRRALLNGEVARVPRRTVREVHRPTHVDRIEWFFSTTGLCEAMTALRGLGPFRTNPGPARRHNWRLIAYKGGSEPGVRNVTLALEHRTSRRVACLSLTWNNPRARLYLPRFNFLLHRALRLLRVALAAPRGPVASTGAPTR